MPKGVEHIFTLNAIKRLTSVESLMPKGVEHEVDSKRGTMISLVLNL